MITFLRFFNFRRNVICYDSVSRCSRFFEQLWWWPIRRRPTCASRKRQRISKYITFYGVGACYGLYVYKQSRRSGRALLHRSGAGAQGPLGPLAQCLNAVQPLKTSLVLMGCTISAGNCPSRKQQQRRRRKLLMTWRWITNSLHNNCRGFRAHPQMTSLTNSCINAWAWVIQVAAAAAARSVYSQTVRDGNIFRLQQIQVQISLYTACSTSCRLPSNRVKNYGLYDQLGHIL